MPERDVYVLHIHWHRPDLGRVDLVDMLFCKSSLSIIPVLTNEYRPFLPRVASVPEPAPCLAAKTTL